MVLRAPALVPRRAKAWLAALCVGCAALGLGAPPAAYAQDDSAVPRGNSGAIIKPPPEEPAPPKPVVKDPELIEFVEGAYPPEAVKEGLEATVLLKLTIDREGHVT